VNTSIFLSGRSMVVMVLATLAILWGLPQAFRLADAWETSSSPRQGVTVRMRDGRTYSGALVVLPFRGYRLLLPEGGSVSIDDLDDVTIAFNPLPASTQASGTLPKK
jgi:hypothetical protein